MQRPRVQYNYHDLISCDELLDKFSIRDKLKEPQYAVQQQDGARLAQHLPDGRGQCHHDYVRIVSSSPFCRAHSQDSTITRIYSSNHYS